MLCQQSFSSPMRTEGLWCMMLGIKVYSYKAETTIWKNLWVRTRQLFHSISPNSSPNYLPFTLTWWLFAIQVPQSSTLLSFFDGPRRPPANHFSSVEKLVWSNLIHFWTVYRTINDKQTNESSVKEKWTFPLFPFSSQKRTEHFPGSCSHTYRFTGSFLPEMCVWGSKPSHEVVANMAKLSIRNIGYRFWQKPHTTHTPLAP